jgi:hypothetical protein
MRIAIRLVIAVPSLALGFLFIHWPPGRLFGGSISEEVIDNCNFQSHAPYTVRASRGNGGATEPYYYSVTVRGRYWPTERQFFYAYDQPEVLQVRCLPSDSIQVVSTNAVYTYALRSVLRHFVWAPLSYSAGKADDSPWWLVAAYCVQGVAAVAIVVGLFLVAPLMKRGPHATLR